MGGFIASRRGWVRLVVGSVAAGALPVAFGRQDAAGDEGRVRERAKRTGLGEIERLETERYVVVGDAGAVYLEAVGKLCEGLATDYLSRFSELGFDVQKPAGRMVVVALAGPEAYRKFIEAEPGVAVAGQYELDTNWLVIFDQRGGEGRGAVSQRANTVALMHEATHQLTFNTGLLPRVGAEVPLAISEGLATYGETRRPDGSEGLGAKNLGRIQDLALAIRAGKEWVDVGQLLDEDGLFLDAQSQQLAYAEAWVMTDYLLAESAPRGRFQESLKALRESRDGARGRVAALKLLGDMATLNRAVKQRANRFARAYL